MYFLDLNCIDLDGRCGCNNITVLPVWSMHDTYTCSELTSPTPILCHARLPKVSLVLFGDSTCCRLHHPFPVWPVELIWRSSVALERCCLPAKHHKWLAPLALMQGLICGMLSCWIRFVFKANWTDAYKTSSIHCVVGGACFSSWPMIKADTEGYTNCAAESPPRKNLRTARAGALPAWLL